MRKRVRLGLLCLFLAFILSGCWSYRSLNDLAIVAGMTVDLDRDTNEYRLGFEIIDLSKDVKTGGLKTVLVESKGKTIFDAARNAKKRLEKKLYYGNTLLLVISEEIAKYNHLPHIIDWFLRDAELRETTQIAVAQTPSASDLLRINGINNAVISFEVANIISDDPGITASLSNPMLYQAYNILQTNGKSLTLPAFHIVSNDEEPVAEANGIAVFKRDSMIGYLTAEQVKYYLFVIGEVKGGIFTFSTKGTQEQDITLEISKASSNNSYVIENGVLNVKVKVEMQAFLAESAVGIDSLNMDEIGALEAMAGAALKERIESIINMVQTDYRSDIFGFGKMIHQQNPGLWKQISDQWDDGFFQSLAVSVNTKVKIENTAYLKNTKRENER